ncbi:glutathione-disulfide reductase [Prochlorococcus sp. MIT 1341]|uniref:glutathione-disulfide reductase n=1 Tax=Prochlorococcus sp. MIT 1341 TaxID=3096221 RepID=UPI002A752472|nr:glutathione-disulfide reductase [Prochlorococcus sp. MIT 1341]
MDHLYDLIVLGAGSGGLAAAKRAASYGANVAIVEGDRVGGTCVIRGCVPKKLLVYGSNYRELTEAASSFGVIFKEVDFDVALLLANVREEVSRLNVLHKTMLKKAGVELFSGWGSFYDPNNIYISRDIGKDTEKVISGKRILIASGGRPSRPSIPGAELGWISDDMFMLEKFPEHVVVVGAGFIACEFSCILHGLGVRVTQLVRGKRMLRGFDEELVNYLQDNMREKGISIIYENSPTAISGKRGKLKVFTHDDSSIDCGGILFATGRKPYIENLRLHNAGVNIEDGRIVVDKNQATNIPSIFAVGDVTDKINLTPVAVDEGRAFADSIYGDSNRVVDHELVAKAVFCDPEIASVGLTEVEAIETYGKSKIRIYKSRFRPMSKALVKRGSGCFLKLVTETHSGKILGCHMAGEHASEIIQMASISIGMGAKKSDFDKTMALHPTVAEEFVTMV